MTSSPGTPARAESATFDCGRFETAWRGAGPAAEWTLLRFGICQRAAPWRPERPEPARSARPSFVTPPFAGYVSGHSTYSRAGVEVLTLVIQRRRVSFRNTRPPWFQSTEGGVCMPARTIANSARQTPYISVADCARPAASHRWTRAIRPRPPRTSRCLASRFSDPKFALDKW